MNKTKTAIALAILLAGLGAAESALAWRHGGPRVSIGIGFGVPFAAYPYYYPPYYYPAYYPAPVVVQQQPTVYVEQPVAAPQVQPQQPSGYWYYCAASQAYYPYVRDCAGGWQRVAPQPQGG